MVIPVHDDNPVRRTPVVTYLLIAANFAAFLLEPIVKNPLLVNAQSAASACSQVAFFERYAAIPRELVHNHHLARVFLGPAPGGCLYGVPTYHKSPVLSVLYAMFLHGGWLHILGNMLFLYVFGNNVEDRFGRIRFLVFYLACGYVAAYAFAFANTGSTQPLIGASGAIAGTLGAYFVLYPRARVTSLVPFLFFFPFRLPAWLVLGSWFLLQYVYSSHAAVTNGAGVAYFAHVAGFAAGALVGLVVRAAGPPPPRRVTYATPRW